MRGGLRANLIQFPAPDERRGIGGLAHLLHRSGNFRSSAACQLDQFRKRFTAQISRIDTRNPRVTLPGDTDQQGALGRRSYVLSFHALEEWSVIVRSERLLRKVTSCLAG